MIVRSAAQKSRKLFAALAASLGLAAAASGQTVLNPSFEELRDPGDQFLFADWIDFTAFINDAEVVPYDGIFAAKQFGLSYYQFPFAVADLPPELRDALPTFDLDGDGVDDCCDTVPANNTVIIQDIGALSVGDEITMTFRYYQRADDAPDPTANLVQGIVNFRDDPWPEPELGRAVTTVDLFNVQSDQWVTYSASATVPAGTNFGEIILIQFQFPTEYSPIDNDGDGVQDVINGVPQFNIVAWGTGASHWDMVELEVSDGCYADYNGDGVVDTRDVLAFLNDWNDSADGSDCNDDGVIDTRDVLCFLNLWAAGC
jgi:hypothetical protein